MMRVIFRNRLVLLVLFVCLLIAKTKGFGEPGSFYSPAQNKDSVSFLRLATDSFYYNPDTAIYYSQKTLEKARLENSPMLVFHSLNLLGLSYWVKSNNKKAFSYYWKAMQVADSLENSRPKFLIYNNISILFKDFEFYDKALEYLVMARKYAITQGEKQLAHINFAATHRKLKHFDLALVYLDSVLLVPDTIKTEIKGIKTFAKVKRAANLTALKRFREAEELLQENFSQINKLDNPYITCLAHQTFGELYILKQQYNKAIDHYNKVLRISKEKNFGNFEMESYRDLATCFEQKGDFVKAMNHLRIYNDLSKINFGVRENIEIYEIDNKFSKYKEESQKRIQLQRIENLKKDKKIFGFWVVIISIIAIFLVINLLLLRKGAKRNKELIEMQKETIMLKNKELTVSALRVIEKDNILANLREKAEEIQQQDLGKSQDQKLVDLLARKHNKSNLNWEEFELSFTNINQSFYKILNDRFPGLTRSELKLIALLKLNLSSKEIASLMAVSPESVKTFRYRLRKKMGVDKNLNLIEFINAIE